MEVREEGKAVKGGRRWATEDKEWVEGEDAGWAVEGEGWRMRDAGRRCGSRGEGEPPPRSTPAPPCLAGQLYRRLAPEESGELRLQVPTRPGTPCRGSPGDSHSYTVC